jgi:hypothetical protein
MTAFLFTGWLTFVVAAISGWYRFLEDCKRFTDRRKETDENDEIEVPRLNSAATKFLKPLSDIQLATGTAILIAGLAQGSNLNFYHEQIIASYWSLTLNSFWAAQLSDEEYDEVKSLPFFVRTSTIWCSLILAIFFQSRQILHDYPRYGYWDPLDGNRCFLLNHDSSGEGQAWLWVVGLSIYALSLFIRLLKYVSTQFWRLVPKWTKAAEMNTGAGGSISQSREGCWLWLDWILKWGRCIFSFDKLDEWLVHKEKISRQDCGPWQRRGNCVLQWILRILSFALTNFLAVWSIGSGSFGIETLAILGYLSWNTLDIIDAKVSNQDLVQNEMSWGFGQVLPMLLLGTFIFNALDVYKDPE